MRQGMTGHSPLHRKFQLALKLRHLAAHVNLFEASADLVLQSPEPCITQRPVSAVAGTKLGSARIDLPAVQIDPA